MERRDEDKAARLAAALRANLKRRKERARGGAPSPDPAARRDDSER